MEEGNYDNIGEGLGKGFTVNVAFNATEDNPLQDLDYKMAFDSLVMPIATEFAPDLVLVSQVQITKCTQAMQYFLSFFNSTTGIHNSSPLFLSVSNNPRLLIGANILDPQSQGYDALKGDLGGYQLTPSGFAYMTKVTFDVLLKLIFLYILYRD